MTAHRALRVGVLLGDKLVEERVFRAGAPITFGQSLRCALSVPGDGIPAEHVLFAHEQGRVLLRLTASMKGRIANGRAMTELPAGTTIPIAQGARGRLQIGDATVLFQEIAAPPVVPRPVLPAAMRPSLVDRVDRRLAAIVGLSLAAHLGIAIYAWSTEADEGSMLAPSIAQTYRHDTIVVELPDKPTPPAPAEEPGPGAATPVAPAQQTGTPIVERPRITTLRPSTKPTPTLGDDDIARFASIMSGNERTESGAGGTMATRKPGADLSTQIADAAGREIRIGRDDETFREQPGPRLGTNTGPRIDAPTHVATSEPKQIERESGRIKIRPVPGQPPNTTLTVEMVLDKINSVYMTGLVRCYGKGLAGDASLSGKVTVSFTVTERGTLEDHAASGVTSDVDACIQTLMGGWRFPIPKNKDGAPDTASFQLVLALQPS
ncbi:MAG: hypothetical protein SFX73_25220 [Kofleriaceae bacterium]|nr:hypothetical protein [Kofleriaceae bacterium]